MKIETLNNDAIIQQKLDNLGYTTTPLLTIEEMNDIKDLNYKVDLQDIVNVYIPLIQLIQTYRETKENLAILKDISLKEPMRTRPFIIGITGSVAVGKTTTSHLLKTLLSRFCKESSIELVTTDGFLYPNSILNKNNLMHRKGFPESYNMELLLNFLNQLKNGQNTKIPIYSHKIYDVIPDETQEIKSSDFIIIEGINIFPNNHINMANYLDLSIYIDAEVHHIETWYLDRFQKILNIAERDPNNYYYHFTQMPFPSVINFSKKIWENINLINLKSNIEPTKKFADIILHKSKNHKIDKLQFKK